MFIMYTIHALSIIGFIIHLLVDKYHFNRRLTKFRVVEVILLYQLIFNVGFAGLLAFVGLAFMPKLVADYLAWPACPFEHELANANLGFAILGILSIWIRGNFWVAIVIGLSIWLLGDAIGHLIHVFAYDNFAPGNAGAPLYADIFVPVALLILLFLYYLFGKRVKRKQ